MKKIINFKRLLKISKQLRKRHKSIVFTNGCFRIITIAHVRYLKIAKSYGDVLIVGLNSDVSVKKIKGYYIVPERQRAEILSEFPFIDYIIIFNGKTPLKILEKLEPEVYVKGGDYKMNKSSVCRNFVMSYGGKVKIARLTFNISTSKIIEKIKRFC